jgi:orotate phosphoribosyltransferase
MHKNTTFYHAAAKLGLIKFSEDIAFKNRKTLGGRAFLIDSRGSGANTRLRGLLIKALQETLHTMPSFDMLGGVANSGTPWAATLAYKLNLPFCNILKEARLSGMQRQIEGDVTGKKVILIDNWINTGESILHAADVIRKHGGDPVGILAIASENRPMLGLPLAYAVEINLLIAAAYDLNLIPASLQQTLSIYKTQQI